MPSRPTSPQLRPCIAEFLRTCFRPQPLLLRLERRAIQTLDSCGTEEADQDEGDTGEGVEQTPMKFCHLWLSDGQLMIQAVLEQPLHHAFLRGEPAVGSLLDVKRFRVRRGKRIHCPGEVVYLAIADYETVLSADSATSTEPDDLANEGGFIREEPQSPKKKRRLSSQLVESLHHPTSPAAMPSTPSSQDSDSFETARVDPEILDQRRQALHELNSNIKPSASWSAPRDQTSRKRQRLLEKKEVPAVTAPARRDITLRFADVDRGTVAAATPSSRGLPQAGLDDSLTIQLPSLPAQPLSTPGAAIATAITPLISTPATPPLHSLSSLLHPPPHSPLPSRNYTCSIFAVISWCSPNLIFPRHALSPFPPKRHIKIHDPSVASRYSGITVAVYDDARKFKPKVGMVALFQGVVMQRWEGEVILNAYARKADRDGDVGEDKHGEKEWYVDDEEKLVGMGHDVNGMRDWWVERKQGQIAKQGSSPRGVVRLERTSPH
jgi:hypothetical protein